MLEINVSFELRTKITVVTKETDNLSRKMSRSGEDDEEEVFAVLKAMSADLMNVDSLLEMSKSSSQTHKNSSIQLARTNMSVPLHSTEKVSSLSKSLNQIPIESQSPRLTKAQFAGQTSLFMNSVSEPLRFKQCSDHFRCRGARATIQCFSCAIYVKSNQAYYCNECFSSRHPSYRVPHIFDTIRNDEDINFNMKLSKHSVELMRIQEDGDQIKRILKNQRSHFQYMAADQVVDTNMRKAGRNLTKLEGIIKNLRSFYPQMIAEKTVQLQHQVAVLIQAVFRGFLARRVVSSMIAQRYLCVWDQLHSQCKFISTFGCIFFCFLIVF